MRILIVEDDITSRILMKRYLAAFGICDVATDGLEALESFHRAHGEAAPYGLICLDIMMPKLDGIATLRAVRDYERCRGLDEGGRVKVIMTTALNDDMTIRESFEAGCEAYVWKPIDVNRFTEVLKELGMIPERQHHSEAGSGA